MLKKYLGMKGGAERHLSSLGQKIRVLVEIIRAAAKDIE
jgi:hypothetical protein